MRLIMVGYLGNGQVAARHATLCLTLQVTGCLSPSPDRITSLRGAGAREGKCNEIQTDTSRGQQSAQGTRVTMFNHVMRSCLVFSEVAQLP